MKTVKEFIEELSILDQDKPIWVYYDQFAAFEPTVDIAEGDEFTATTTRVINEGDYIIEAW